MLKMKIFFIIISALWKNLPIKQAFKRKKIA